MDLALMLGAAWGCRLVVDLGLQALLVQGLVRTTETSIDVLGLATGGLTYLAAILVGAWRAGLWPQPWEVRLPGAGEGRWILRLLLACALGWLLLRWVGQHGGGFRLRLQGPWSAWGWVRLLVLGCLGQVLYRGILQRGLEPRLGVWGACLGASLIGAGEPLRLYYALFISLCYGPTFGLGLGPRLLHGLQGCLPLLGPSLAAGWLYARTGGLAPVLAFQVLWLVGLSLAGRWPVATLWGLVLGGLLVAGDLLASLQPRAGTDA